VYAFDEALPPFLSRLKLNALMAAKASFKSIIETRPHYKASQNIVQIIKILIQWGTDGELVHLQV
jgi:hypothetical protein